MFNPWDDARRAWDRLSGRPQNPRPAHDALEALADIGLLRRFLDDLEQAAVAAARGQGRSWAEIASRLGVARQSAWERWRERGPQLKETDLTPPLADERLLEEPTRGWAHVPDVLHQRWDAALRCLDEEDLVGVHADPDTPPEAVPRWPNVVVTDQSPESGAFVERGSLVRLWLAPGGGSAGMREPRRPSPSPRSAYQERAELSDDAVG